MASCPEFWFFFSLTLPCALRTHTFYTYTHSEYKTYVPLLPPTTAFCFFLSYVLSLSPLISHCCHCTSQVKLWTENIGSIFFFSLVFWFLCSVHRKKITTLHLQHPFEQYIHLVCVCVCVLWGYKKREAKNMQQHLLQMQPMMAAYYPTNVTTDHIQQVFLLPPSLLLLLSLLL